MIYLKTFEQYSTSDAYDDLRKHWKKNKYGLRNLNDYLFGKVKNRSMNPYSLADAIVKMCIEDRNMLTDQNWSFIFDNARYAKGEKGLDLIKYIVENYQPSKDQIFKVFKSVIETFRVETEYSHGLEKFKTRNLKSVPVADYLLPLVADKDLKEDISGYGWRYQSDLWRANWYAFKGIIGCDVENGPRTRKLNALDGLYFIGRNETEYTGWQVLKHPKCEYTEEFYAKMKKHPNNGGINASERHFDSYMKNFIKIENFWESLKKYPQHWDLEEDHERLLQNEDEDEETSRRRSLNRGR